MADTSHKHILRGSGFEFPIIGFGRKAGANKFHLVAEIGAGYIATVCSRNVSWVQLWRSPLAGIDFILEQDERICPSCYDTTGRLVVPHDAEGKVVDDG